ncbi:MAG: hypothetical protein JWQ17_6451 [Tardiphaga sp.]|nr:hypothetical protein [Tardiphaga sp.]
MQKSNISAGVYSERETKSGLEKGFDINTLRKPLKMTATLRRRALKKKPVQNPPERAYEQSPSICPDQQITPGCDETAST